MCIRDRCWCGQAPLMPGGRPGPGGSCKRARTRSWRRRSGSWKKGLIIAGSQGRAQRRLASGRQRVRSTPAVTPAGAPDRRPGRNGDTRRPGPPEGWVNKSPPDVYLAIEVLPNGETAPRAAPPERQQRTLECTHALPHRLQRRLARQPTRSHRYRRLAPALSGLFLSLIHI